MRVKNNIACVLILITATLLQADSLEKRNVRALEAMFEYRGTIANPLIESHSIHNVVINLDGIPHVCTTISGEPAKFIVFNLEKGEISYEFAVPKGGTFWSHVVDSKNNVYFAGYSNATLYKFCAASRKIIEIGSLFGESAAIKLTVDDNDNIFIGTFPNAKLIEYNVGKSTMIDHGVKIQNSQYLRSLIYHNGYLYAGGLGLNSEFIKICRDSLNVKKLKGPDINGVITDYYYSSMARDYIFFDVFYLCGESSNSIRSLLVYDTKKELWIPFEKRKFQGLVVSQEVAGSVFFPAQGTIWELNLESFDIIDRKWPFGTAFRGSGVVNVRNAPGISGPALVNSFYTCSTIFLRDTINGNHHIFKNRPTGIPQWIKSFAVSENHLVLGAYMGVNAAVISLDDFTSYNVPMGQPESIFINKFNQNEIFFGVYPEANVQLYNSEIDITRNINPYELFNVKAYGQSRPFALYADNEQVIAGFIAEYGMLDGSLAIYDRATSELTVKSGLIANQSITSILPLNEYIYICTTVWGGLGIEPSETAAKVIKYDPRTQAVIAETTLTLPSVGTQSLAIGGIALGQCGNLWINSYGNVFILGPDNLNLKQAIELQPNRWNRGRMWRPLEVFSHNSGYVFANSLGTLVAINPSNYDVKNVLSSTFTNQLNLVISHPSGDIFFTTESNILHNASFLDK